MNGVRQATGTVIALALAMNGLAILIPEWPSWLNGCAFGLCLGLSIFHVICGFLEERVRQ